MLATAFYRARYSRSSTSSGSSSALLACEGIASGIEPVIAQVRDHDAALYTRIIQLVIQTASDPSILGTSSHLLYIGQAQGVPPFRSQVEACR